MQVYGAKEIVSMGGEPTGKYHYGCSDSSGTYPIGYCAQGCPGHDTADEARSHQRQYEIEQEADRFEDVDTQKKCLVCGTWTTLRVKVGHTFTQMYALCAEHDSVEELDKVVPARTIQEPQIAPKSLES